MNDLKHVKIEFHGMDKVKNGMALPAGDYQFFAEGEDASGGKIAINTEFSGKSLV